MDESKAVKQNLIIKNRNQISIDGVRNVEGFDDGYVNISTDAGRLIIEGENLKIEGLTKENGVILISGRIDAVIYSDEKPRAGFFGKLFK